jgi:hypothetical protein
MIVRLGTFASEFQDRWTAPGTMGHNGRTPIRR